MERIDTGDVFQPLWLLPWRMRQKGAGPLRAFGGRRTPRWIGALALGALVALGCHDGAAHAASRLKELYSFRNLRGTTPAASLLADGAGNLYGTASAGGANGVGVVFELSPPIDGQRAWTETVLHSFDNADGDFPSAGLIVDGAGNLYGTTLEGGANGAGVVFELSPPPAGATVWTETVLHSFDGNDGALPEAGLIMDGAGNLYGSADQGGEFRKGVAYELIRPAEGHMTWTETVLCSFRGAGGQTPAGTLLLDGEGNLYGTAVYGGKGGVVYELSPPPEGQTAWTETVLHHFNVTDGENPVAGLIADGAGNLYGTTLSGGMNGVGVVFELSPPRAGKTARTETVLQSFNTATGSGSYAGLLADSGGNLYGTTKFGGAKNKGVVFELTKPAKGQTAWNEVVLHSFSGADGSYAQAGLIADGAGNLYGTAPQGGKHQAGVVFKLTP